MNDRIRPFNKSKIENFKVCTFNSSMFGNMIEAGIFLLQFLSK